jgi:Domain of unknown function (DUF4150)
MAVNPIGSNPLGTIVPPGVKPNAAQVLQLRQKLDLVHAQLMSGMRHSPQRMAELLNAYLDAVRRLHGSSVAALRAEVVHKSDGQSAGMAVNVCKTPTPGGPVPLPYPNVSASSATKTPGTKEAQRPKLETTHQKIKSGVGDEAGSMSGLVSSHVKGVCEYMAYSFDVMFEGKNVCRLGDPLFHNRRP